MSGLITVIGALINALVPFSNSHLGCDDDDEDDDDHTQRLTI